MPLCLAVFCTSVRGGAEDTPDPDEETWRVEEARFRFVYYDQDGFGYQSQAGPGPKGSEALSVYEPMLYLRVRQNSRVEHTVALPVDVITSASTNAVDAITSASRVNEAVTLQIESRIQSTADDAVEVTYGAHVEEWFYSVFAGVEYTRDLAQDNATVSFRVDGSFDWFRAYGPWPGGLFPPGNEFDLRGAFGGTLQASQILNPTTSFKAGYGVSWQKGALLTPWNSVPVFCNGDLTDCLARIQERFRAPQTRISRSSRRTNGASSCFSTSRLQGHPISTTSTSSSIDTAAPMI